MQKGVILALRKPSQGGEYENRRRLPPAASFIKSRRFSQIARQAPSLSWDLGLELHSGLVRGEQFDGDQSVGPPPQFSRHGKTGLDALSWAEHRHPAPGFQPARRDGSGASPDGLVAELAASASTL